MKTLLRRGAFGLTAGALSVAGLMPAAHARGGEPVPSADAGTVVAWGNYPEETTIPSGLDGVAVTAVAGGNNFSLALTEAGNVVAWGRPAAGSVLTVPSDLTHVKAVAAGGTAALALKSDGTVTAWGDPTSGVTDVPADLTGVTSIDAGVGQVAAAVKSDGTVVEWGTAAGTGAWPVPSTLTGVTEVAIGTLHVLALKADHTIQAWGNPLAATVPTDIQGHVVDVAAGGLSSVALLDDGTIRAWGANGTAITAPSGLDGQTVTSIDVAGTQAGGPIIASTASGKVFVWNGTSADSPAMTSVPDSLTGEPIAAVAAGSTQALALVTSYRKLTEAAVTGTPKVGQTLTVTPATFSLEPDDVTTQWFAGGDPIDDATDDTLALTTDQLGKQITVKQTATRGSEELTSISAAVGPVGAAQATTTLSATARAGAFGTATTVTVKATPGTATGTVQVADGATKLGSGTLSNGTATVTLPGTALAAGTHTLTVTYAGDAGASAASTTTSVTIGRAAADVTAKVKPKKLTKAKLKKARATVSVGASGFTPTGTVEVMLKNKSVGTGTLANGKVTVKLAKLKKLAKQAKKLKLQVRYSGDGNTVAATTTLKVKLKH